jgi:hypothetical protein
MSKTYELELKIILTDEQQEKLMEAARRVYAVGSPSVRYEGETSRELSPEEFIDGPVSALMYVIEQNAILDELDIRADEVSYTDPDYEAADEDPATGEFEEADSEAATSVADSTDDEELDEWGEGLYLCRWPNGDFSVVKADSKRDALVQLDEWAGAESTRLRYQLHIIHNQRAELAERGPRRTTLSRDHGHNMTAV